MRSLASYFTRTTTTPEPPMPETTPVAETPADDNVLIHFLTVGGATVEVYPTRFVTRWASCPPFAAKEPYEIDGFQWRCGGCDAYGRQGETYLDRCFRNRAEARDDANDHAEKCRAMPRPRAA